MTFSGEMMMALLIIGGLVFFCYDRRWVAWLVAAGVLIGIALVAAETRSMWAGAGAGGIYLLWFWRRWTVIALPVPGAVRFYTHAAEAAGGFRSSLGAAHRRGRDHRDHDRGVGRSESGHQRGAGDVFSRLWDADTPSC